MVMNFAFRWSWILGLALFLPVSLPAGGLEIKKTVISRSIIRSNSYIHSDSCFLQVSPFAFSPTLRLVRCGTPLEVLRTWQSPNGKTWLHVQIASHELIETNSLARRGWLSV